MIFNHLQEFRQTLYEALGNGRDALFDLMDAVLVSGCIRSFVSLSQSPVFRREWSSIGRFSELTNYPSIRLS